MGAEMKTNVKNFFFFYFRRPNSILLTATLLLIIYAVCCVLVPILTVSGYILNHQSLGCKNSDQDLVEFRLGIEFSAVFIWTGFSLLFCACLLLKVWIKKGSNLKVLLGCSVVVTLYLSYCMYLFGDKEREDLEEFKQHYNLFLQNITDTAGNTQNQFTNTTCNTLNSVYRWQAEFKCCGLNSYRDWGSSIPDSCLCDSSSECVGVGLSFVYEKPCLPTVLPLVETRSSTLWTILGFWLFINIFPIVTCVMLFLGGFFYWSFLMSYEMWFQLSKEIHQCRGREEMVAVVFIKKLNINQGSTSVEEEGREAAYEDRDYNPVRLIPQSELMRLQEELDYPPVPHQVPYYSILPNEPKYFYTIHLEEDSPQLPSYAVLVDPTKPTKRCFWKEGRNTFNIEHIVWPRKLDGSVIV